MITLLFRVLVIFLIHIVLFAAYPETGKYGNLYLAVSLFLWTGIMILISGAIKAAKFFSGFIGFVMLAGVYAFNVLVLTMTMPQKDKTLVFEKIQNGNYSNYRTFRKGLIRFGIDWDKGIEKASEMLEEQKTDFKPAAGIKDNPTVKKGTEEAKKLINE